MKRTLLLFLISLNLYASYVVPPLNKVLVREDSSRELALEMNHTYSVLVWNIYKQSKAEFYQEIEFMNGFDLALLQEINQTECWDKFLSNFNIDYNFAISFYDDGVATGVGLLSKIQFRKIEFDRSRSREPIIKTPKMTIMGELEIDGSDKTLKVVSIHGLNFVRNKFFNGQINTIVEKLKSHKGPLIWAGDFNTWNKSRLWYMNYRLAQLNLTKVDLADDHYVKRFAGKPLDHVFARGVDIVDSKAISRKQSSDHNPLSFNFKLN